MLQELKDIFKDRYMENIPLKDHTSFKTGGNAQILVEVKSEEEFIKGINCVKRMKLPYFVFGNCSNVLISDKGLQGVVFLITSEFAKYHIEDETIESESGILLSTLSKIAYDNSLTGLEFAAGIPGSLGAAIVINAGAYGGQMSDIVTETRYLDEKAIVKTVITDKHDFGYRNSVFVESDNYILSSKMKLKKGRKEDIKLLMKNLNEKRKEKQPLTMPSAGSVFKRPSGYFAGKLIQDAGLMGHRIGDAQVSTLHAGFIVNAGKADSNDIYLLIQYVKENVKNKFGVELETEIKILGEFDC